MKVEIVATIATAPGPIWAALVMPRNMDQWLASEAQFEARVGKAYRLVVPMAGEPEVVTGRVVAWVPEVRLSFSMVGSTAEGPLGAETTVTFFLASLNGSTKVTLVHDGFKKLSAKRRTDAVEALETFWCQAFERLQRHLGLPVAPVEITAATPA